MGFLKWLQAGPARVKRAIRHPRPGLSSYYWDGGAPVARDVKDISVSGAFLCTPNSEEFYPGTIVSIVLQRASAQDGSAVESDSVHISCKVARRAGDGVGVRFVFGNAAERKSLEKFLRSILKSANGNAISGKDTEGQALVEFALMVPFLFLLILITVNFGGFLYGWITVANAARAGAQYASLGGASVKGPATPTSAEVQTLITTDASSLPAGVSVCVNTNATASAITGTCSFTIAAVPADPEAPQYALVAVDANYQVTSFFPHFEFPALGITDLPSLPTHIHRRTVMRVLN
jgi:Flp pilus assembly protein TadG